MMVVSVVVVVEHAWQALEGGRAELVVHRVVRGGLLVVLLELRLLKLLLLVVM